MKRFVKISAVFCLGLVILTVALDRILGWRIRRADGEPLIGREVYVAQKIAAKHDDATRELYLGDSVAKQVFPPGEEPGHDPTIKYVTTNQAISMAGQYYLLSDTLATHPNVKRVYLFYTPSAWGNDLDQAYTHDYFCGYFHKPSQVREAFAVKKDWDLLGAHIGRMLLPNILATNSSMSLKAGGPKRSWAKETERGAKIEVSNVSQAYMRRIRELCKSRGIELRVYPSPVSDQFLFTDPGNLYDAPIAYLKAENFQDDTIHLKRPYVEAARYELVSRLALPLNVPRPTPARETADEGPRNAAVTETGRPGVVDVRLDQ
jgi:hypothetical protein